MAHRTDMKEQPRAFDDGKENAGDAKGLPSWISSLEGMIAASVCSGQTPRP
jgi:hypothetical protein